jgi:hypothetical protein
MKNKFGFRPLRPESTSQVKPQAHKANSRSPKRPRDHDVPVASGGQTRAKRTKPSNSLSRPPVVEISDNVESGADADRSNQHSIAASRAAFCLWSRSIPGDPSNTHIVDLTIDLPPSDSSPEPSASSDADRQRESDLPVMLDANEITANSDVQYQFTFQKSRSDPFVKVIKTEVEMKVSPMLPR